MQTVKTVLEDLSRFSPDARVEPELEIDGVSPLTECVVKTRAQDEAKAELEKAKAESEGLEDELSRVTSAIRELHTSLSEAIAKKNWKRVSEVCEELSYLK